MSKKSEKSEKDFIKFLDNLPIGIFELVYSYSTQKAIPVQATNSETKKVVTIISDITELKTKAIEE